MVKYFAHIFFWCFLYSGLSGQSYEVANYYLEIADENREGRIVGMRIFYPISTNEEHAALAFGHGFVIRIEAYFTLANYFASHGFVCALVDTESSASVSHSNFADDLIFSIEVLQFLGTQDSSILHEKVSEHSAVMGHSMGGGSALLAAQRAMDIDLVITYASAETTPSAITASASLTQPALYFAGEKDCITPVIENQLAMFETTPSENCSFFVEILGGSHCQFSDTEADGICEVGEFLSCPDETYINLSEQTNIYQPLTVAWLKKHFNNEESWTQAIGEFQSNGSINTESRCITTGTELLNVDSTILITNLVGHHIWFKNNVLSELESIQILGLDGRIALKIDPKNGSTTSIKRLPKGAYILTYEKQGSLFTEKIIKL